MIEDNPRLAERMQRQLQKQFIIEVAESGSVALQLSAQNTYDLIMLDLGLPDMPGLEVCKHLRSLGTTTPILVVSGIDTTTSRVELLDTGADDYITKPFDSAELFARINALSRRRLQTNHLPLITVGDLIINRSSRSVTRAGVEIALRKKEFDILEYLALNRGRVMPRQMIINHAWPSNSSTWVGSVDVHIKQLRDKIDRPFSYPLIKTSYGVGYTVDIPKKANVKKEMP